MNSVGIIISDLAPGDFASVKFDWKNFEVVQITSPNHPLFTQVFQKLWSEFGSKGELEQIDILSRRFQWDPSKAEKSHSFSYEIIAVLKDDEIVAVRDHTAILRHEAPTEAIVHLSHVLVDPEYRGTGLAGWLRAWPIQLARQALMKAKIDPESPITLVCEMEPADPRIRETIARLKSYQKAGFRMLDPKQVRYLQPDFKSPIEIDRTGGAQPLPLHLLVRRVGRENELELTGSHISRMMTALYQMYGSFFRQQDMAPVWENFQSTCPNPFSKVPLIQPIGRGL